MPLVSPRKYDKRAAYLSTYVAFSGYPPAPPDVSILLLPPQALLNLYPQLWSAFTHLCSIRCLLQFAMSSSTKDPKKNFSWHQFFPPKPKYTDQDVPSDLHSKVYVVTGANSGMGKELARVLYSKNARVYVACRSPEKGAEAISDIEKATPASRGKLVLLTLDLADLTSVQAAAKEFLSMESKLHVLFNNAGVMVGPMEPPPKTAQGIELSLGVNCVGTFLFTRLLTPALITAAKSEPADSVRVVWLSSFGLEQFAPSGRGIDIDNLDYHEPKPHIERYGASKAGDWLLGVEFARRHKADGIVSAAINPGNIRTALARDQGAVLKLVANAVVYPVINGVYTQLFAGFSPDVPKADWTKKWSKSHDKLFS